ncbi:MAG: hypothetical protein AAF669_09210 [Pseudomonadota bacterium]
MLRFVFRTVGVLIVLQLSVIVVVRATFANGGTGVLSYRDIDSVSEQRGIYLYDIDRDLHHYLLPFTAPFLTYTWTATGDSILFVQQEDAEGYRLYEYDIVAATRRDLPRIWEGPVSLNMAPDGENLAVIGTGFVEIVRWQEPDLPSQVLLDATDTVNIAISADWSTDGRKLLIATRPDAESFFRVVELDIATGTQTDLFATTKLSNPGVQYLSQDEIVYESAASRTNDVMSHNLLTDTTRQIVHNIGTPGYFVLSDDHETLLVIDLTFADRSLTLMDLDTGETRSLTESALYAVQWVPR